MEMSGRTLGRWGKVDDFSRRNLPPFEQRPELQLDRPEFQYPEYLNAAVELTDRIVEKGMGDRIALIGNGILLLAWRAVYSTRLARRTSPATG